MHKTYRTVPEVPQALAEIRSIFSLNTAEMAEIFKVSRQTIYDWIAGGKINPGSRQRIAEVYYLAKTTIVRIEARSRADGSNKRGLFACERHNMSPVRGQAYREWRLLKGVERCLTFVIRGLKLPDYVGCWRTVFLRSRGASAPGAVFSVSISCGITSHYLTVLS